MALWLALAGLWITFATKGLRALHSGTRGLWTSALAQISALTFLAATLRFGPLAGAAAGLTPPVLLPALRDIPTLAITGKIALYALPAMAITVAICLRVPRLTPFTLLLSGLVLLGSSLLTGNLIAHQNICSSAPLLHCSTAPLLKPKA